MANAIKVKFTCKLQNQLEWVNCFLCDKINLFAVKSLVWVVAFTKLYLDDVALSMKLLNWRHIVKGRGKRIYALQNCSHGKLQTCQIGLAMPVLQKH